ncbi:MAG: hypothetical protein COX57_01120 [Alphaproteobacteria bacterium CG_4_10_14_0_2_um_filter_63_37]|nr:MAG: hypothetical protein AUJ55_11095 [Proteobacteria bacterium CG1_02_64_396]PJA25921.1 MAG: hypothetical protein COX57_01120 [Alphaproteobacteria bacterium CG_4_10_14_0_2_um_filter_63_37]
MSHRHLLYGLTLESVIPLPEAPEIAADGAADVCIVRGQASEALLPESSRLTPNLKIAADAVWLRVPQVGSFLAQGGNRVVIDAEPGADEDTLRLFLLGSMLGAILLQRGFLVLHGNAVALDGQALLCLGRSGAGKSTLAAAFMKRGHPVLADDVVPVCADGNAIPGIPRIKLWQEAADDLAIDTSGLQRIGRDFEKYHLPLAHAQPLAPMPVRWVYILIPHDGHDLRFEAIEGRNRFLPLSRNLYRRRFGSAMGRHEAQLAQIGLLAGRIRLCRILRPAGGDYPAEKLAGLILDDIARNAPAQGTGG